MNIAQFTHSAVDGHLNHFLCVGEGGEAIMNNTAVTVLVQIFL